MKINTLEDINTALSAVEVDKSIISIKGYVDSKGVTHNYELIQNPKGWYTAAIQESLDMIQNPEFITKVEDAVEKWFPSGCGLENMQNIMQAAINKKQASFLTHINSKDIPIMKKAYTAPVAQDCVYVENTRRTARRDIQTELILDAKSAERVLMHLLPIGAYVPRLKLAPGKVEEITVK